jgi:hypothetical protein
MEKLMAGKTISMHASEETARRVEQVSRLEDRSPSQIASAALNFYLQLPSEAHTALRHVQALGTSEDVARISRKVARLLLDAQFEVAEQRVVASMTTQGLEALESEDDVIAEANALTSHSRIRNADTRSGAAPQAAPKRRRTA